MSCSKRFVHRQLKKMWVRFYQKDDNSTEYRQCNSTTIRKAAIAPDPVYHLKS